MEPRLNNANGWVSRVDDDRSLLPTQQPHISCHLIQIERIADTHYPYTFSM